MRRLNIALVLACLAIWPYALTAHLVKQQPKRGQKIHFTSERVGDHFTSPHVVESPVQSEVKAKINPDDTVTLTSSLDFLNSRFDRIVRWEVEMWEGDTRTDVFKQEPIKLPKKKAKILPFEMTLPPLPPGDYFFSVGVEGFNPYQDVWEMMSVGSVEVTIP